MKAIIISINTQHLQNTNMVRIKKIRSKIESVEGVEATIVKTGYSVWIHAILRAGAERSEVSDGIDSIDISTIEQSSSYQVGGGILRSSREVIKIKVS